MSDLTPEQRAEALRLKREAMRPDPLGAAESAVYYWMARSERAEARVKRLEEALRAIQAVAVTSQNHHAEPHRLDWLREIEGRARAALEEGAE